MGELACKFHILSATPVHLIKLDNSKIPYKSIHLTEINQNNLKKICKINEEKLNRFFCKNFTNTTEYILDGDFRVKVGNFLDTLNRKNYNLAKTINTKVISTLDENLILRRIKDILSAGNLIFGTDFFNDSNKILDFLQKYFPSAIFSNFQCFDYSEDKIL